MATQGILISQGLVILMTSEYFAGRLSPNATLKGDILVNGKKKRLSYGMAVSKTATRRTWMSIVRLLVMDYFGAEVSFGVKMGK